MRKKSEININILKPIIKMRKISQVQSLNSFLNSYANSVRAQKNSEKSILSEDSNKWADENLIDHYWTIIKNSQDQTQIAENYLNLGDAYWKENDFQNALQTYRKAFNKGRLEANGRIGNLYYHKGKIEKAAQYFEKYLKLVDESDH